MESWMSFREFRVTKSGKKMKRDKSLGLDPWTYLLLEPTILPAYSPDWLLLQSFGINFAVERLSSKKLLLNYCTETVATIALDFLQPAGHLLSSVQSRNILTC